MAIKHEKSQTIDLLKSFSAYDFFVFYIKRIKIAIVIVLVFLIAGLAYLFLFSVNKYEATAKLYVPEFSLAKDYQMIFTTREVHEMVENNLENRFPAEEIGHMVTVVNPTDTRTLIVTVRCTAGKDAEEIANALAIAGCEYINDVMHSEKPIIISSAKSSNIPVSPRRGLTMEILFLLGVLCSFWVAFLIYLGDDKVRTAQEIRNITNIETVVVIPDEKINKR